MQLVPVTDEVFKGVQGFIIRFLAQELIDNKAFDNDSEAYVVAPKVIATLLPDDEQTPNHYLFQVYNDSQDVAGILWYFHTETPEPTMHLAFIYINEGQRCKGIARWCLQKVEQAARDQGCQTISLGVFANNSVAIKLYESHGYQKREKIDLIGYGKPVRYKMTKVLWEKEG